jgi:cysteinyl-tRNA synthetase
VRFLRTRYAVKYVRNITDIDDKINAAAAALGESIETVSARHAADYHADMDALGVLPPDVEPFATHHLDEMKAMIQTLIDGEHAYAAEGHVLFRVSSYADYGSLSRRDLRQLIDGARVDVAPYKESPGDFVLWKPSTPEQPGWDSPWGRGRPGWHIECSAMAEKHLGETIDIHGGGNDLIFPHHENEIAQSTCAHGGKPFSRYWLHNGFVNIDSSKMSKSVGNVVLVRDLLEQSTGEVVRLALLSAHYRQPLDWSAHLLVESRRRLDRLYNALRSVDAWQADWQTTDLSDDFVAAMEDDINTPRALAALFSLARDINKHDDAAAAAALARQLRAGGELLGLLGSDPAEWFGAGVQDDAAAIDELLLARNAARAARDFAEADRIRDQLSAMGIVIEDSSDGSRWRRVDNADGA